MSEEKFDLQVVKDKFSAALIEADDVGLEDYLTSFDELNKFFTLLGTIFTFVSKDLRQKMDILREFLSKPEECSNFKSVKTMIEYEKENNLLDKQDYTSGSRTLLRIHRGLDFIRVFLKAISELKDDQSTSGPCSKAYDQTLAKYHSFFIRQGAYLAMYTLPTRGNLLLKVCGNEEEIKKATDILPETLEIMGQVYDRTEALYTVYDLHGLP